MRLRVMVCLIIVVNCCRSGFSQLTELDAIDKKEGQFGGIGAMIAQSLIS